MDATAPNVFLVPSSNQEAKANFEQTVLDGISGDRIRTLSSIPFSADTLSVWGTREGNLGTWKKIREGDYLLFYQDRHYPYAAQVLTTEENEKLGKNLWPNHEDGDPWKYIMYLIDVAEADISREEINRLAGYTQSFAPTGFQSLRPTAVNSIRKQHGSVWRYITESNSKKSQTSNLDIRTEPSISVPKSVLDGLYFPEHLGEEILDQINAALNAEKHVIFTGPPGTGKTEVARRVSEHLVESHPQIFSGYEMTTATADWSVFETVGGYMPDTQNENQGDLTFEPGQVLSRFKQQGSQRNDILIIDEINRADIDKSFGQLFTLLSGQTVQLPYKRDGNEIEVHPASTFESEPAEYQYLMPNSWRILATMNSYDKTSLYEMSYAFMRRFAFIHIGAPDIPEERSKRENLVRKYAETWEYSLDAKTVQGLADIWYATNAGMDRRKVGPAILKDMLVHMRGSENKSLAITHAVTDYIFPQLEGIPERRQIVKRLGNIDQVQEDHLWRLARDVLRVTPNE